MRSNWKAALLTTQLFVLASMVVVGMALVAPVAADTEATTEISDELRAALSAPLAEKRKQLSEMKNDEGQSYVRGFHSRRFDRVDDESYTVRFHTSTAGSDQLKLESARITLKQDDGGKWKIDGEEPDEVREGLMSRSVPGDETFHKFESLAFDREGFKLSGGPGHLVVDYRRGKPTFLSFFVENLSYELDPPEGTVQVGILDILKKKFEENIEFESEVGSFQCLDCADLLATTFTGLSDSTLEQMEPELKKSYTENIEDQRKARKDSAMSGFGPDARPGRTWWRALIKRKAGPDLYLGIDFDTEEPMEVSLWSSRTGPLFRYYSTETRNSGTPPAELERRPDSEALDYEVTSLKGSVEAAVLDSEQMSCDVTFGIKIRREVDRLPFFIPKLPTPTGGQRRSAALNVESIEDGDGNELIFVPTSSSRGYVLLPETMSEGDELELRVKFDNKGSILNFNPSFSYVDRQGWLPFVRFGDMIHELDLTVTVPKRFEILGIGHPESETIKGGLRTARFVAANPVSFATFIFGDYQSDKPKFDAKKLDGTVIPVNIYVDKTAMTTSSQKVRSQEDWEMAMGETSAGSRGIRGGSMRPIAAQAANAINLYTEVFGVDYPFRKLDLVADPVGVLGSLYGQAPSSIVYLGYNVFTATSRLVSSGADGQVLGAFKESVVAHEVGHQWWGGVVAHANYGNYWFVESLAEYASSLYIESLAASRDKKGDGSKDYLEMVSSWRDRILGAKLMNSVQNATTMWAGLTGDAGTAAIYAKGPYAFHMLRVTFGDEEFLPFLKKLATELAGKEIVTRDIQRVAEESFSGNMEWFFDQWIRGVGIPEYSFNYTTRRAEDRNYIVEGTIKQRIVVADENEKYPLPVKPFRGIARITVTGKDKQEYPVRLLIEEAETPFIFKVPVEPEEVAFNKYGDVLAYDVLVNESF